MKILVLHSELGVLRGGGENFTRNLFTAFAERGHQVAAAFVAHRMRGYPIPLPTPIEPIPIRGWWSRKLGQATLSFMSGLLPTGSRIKTEWDRVQGALCWRTIRWHRRRFQKSIERELTRRWDDFDAVYVHGNIPLATHVARSRPTVLRLPGPVTAETAQALRTVQAVCANGDALARLRTFLGEHVIELPVGVDDKLFTSGPTFIRSALGWTEQHTVMGYVGRLAYVKGTDLLAAAFREISQSIPNARLLIIGSGEEEKKLRFILADELTRGVVHIEPDVEHERLPQWYRAMDVLVMPSRYENFSNAILEAMACGLPILASNVGGNKMVEEVGGGWLFQSDAPASLGERLCSLVDKPEEMRARGATGSRYVQKRYSWTASAICLEEIIGRRLRVNI
jgi:glycosyltransferase involved in cell wall biosynthesis